MGQQPLRTSKENSQSSYIQTLLAYRKSLSLSLTHSIGSGTQENLLDCVVC